jgi:hypothetical protein
LTKPLYFYNGTTFEQVGPTTPQSPIAYQTSAPTGPATGDLWIDSDGDVDTYNRQLTRYYFVATAAQTTITGTDANGLTLAYVAGSEAVYVNGALQVRGQDYTATNGTSVVMSSGLAVNDVVEIFAYTAFTVANAYTKSETDGLVGSAAGLKLLTPTSVAVGSGSGSVTSTGTVTFSGASSVSLNGVFSSTYKNYKILTNCSASTGTYLTGRLRVSGTDNSASAYTSGSNYVQYNPSGSPTSDNQSGVGTSWSRIAYMNADDNQIETNLMNPFVTGKTSFYGFLNRATDSLIMMVGGSHSASTSFDGLTLIPASGTITGTISVYGLKN